MATFGRRQQVEKAEGLLDELRSLQRVFPEDSAIAGSFASGLLNAVADCSHRQQMENVEVLLNELRSLHSAFPEQPNVTGYLAFGMLNAIRAYRKRQQIEKVGEISADLVLIIENYPRLREHPFFDEILRGYKS